MIEVNFGGGKVSPRLAGAKTRQAQRLARFRARETVGMPMQPRYQIHLYHDGARYAAAVPELDGCSGTGQSYAEALASAEKAIASWVFAAINQGKPPPEPAKDFVLRPRPANG